MIYLYANTVTAYGRCMGDGPCEPNQPFVPHDQRLVAVVHTDRTVLAVDVSDPRHYAIVHNYAVHTGSRIRLYLLDGETWASSCIPSHQ